MLNYDISWSYFNIVEVMSHPWFGHRRIGYLAASQAFSQDTDVVLLTTHLFRKAFQQNQTGITNAAGLQYETGAAISCLANIVTQDLAMDLLADIYGMMNSSRPYVRKKATLILLRIFMCWPKALRMSFDRLKSKLEDSDPGVVSAAVYVLCELAKTNPKNYIALAPVFFKILTTSLNNWVLIKVVKLMGSLVPYEPRLAKKLQQPLTNIIENTPAKSLMYECVNTLLSGEVTSKSVVQLCLARLTSFIEDNDQNLKYLGLLGLHKLMKQHPRVVAEHRDLILNCLTDEDVTIRMRALDLICSMVSVRNIHAVVARLMDHLDTVDGDYREHVLERILFICTQDNYAFIEDFEWFIRVLVDLTQDGGSRDNAQRINTQLLDVVLRVEGVQQFAVSAMCELLNDNHMLHQSNPMSEVLHAAAWIIGEYAEFVEHPANIATILLSEPVAALSQPVQNIFVHSFVKVFANLLVRKSTSGNGSGSGTGADEFNIDMTESGADSENAELKMSADEWSEAVTRVGDMAKQRLESFSRSNFVEVQERAVAYSNFVPYIVEQALIGNGSIVAQFATLFGRGDKLEPVSSRAQTKVKVPKGLSLKKRINPVEPDSEADDTMDNMDFGSSDADDVFGFVSERKELTEDEKESARKRVESNRKRREQDPFYIKDGMSSARSNVSTDSMNVSDIPIRTADFDLPPVQVENRSSRRRSSAMHSSSTGGKFRVKHRRDNDDSKRHSRHASKASDKHGLGAVDLSAPLGEDEIISQPRSYAEQRQRAEKGKKGKKKSKKDKKKSKKDSKKSKKANRNHSDDEDGNLSNIASVEASPAILAASAAAAAAPVGQLNLFDEFDPLSVSTTNSSAATHDDAGADDVHPHSPKGKKSKKKSNKKHKKKRSNSIAASDHGANVHLNPKARLACEDSNVVVMHYAVSHETKRKAVVLSLHVENRSSSDITDVHSVVEGVSALKVKKSAKPVPSIGAGSFASIELTLSASTSKFNAPQELPLTVTYTRADDSKATTLSGMCSIPLSATVQPHHTTLEDLQEVFARTSDDGKNFACTSLSSGDVQLGRHTLQNALKLIPKVIHVQLVVAANFAATYYGKTIHGYDVGVLVKADAAAFKSNALTKIKVEIKSAKQPLCDALLQELIDAFAK
jgi:AP-3 complex subunit delta